MDVDGKALYARDDLREVLWFLEEPGAVMLRPDPVSAGLTHWLARRGNAWPRHLRNMPIGQEAPPGKPPEPSDWLGLIAVEGHAIGGHLGLVAIVGALDRGSAEAQVRWWLRQDPRRHGYVLPAYPVSRL